ncbi:MAG: DUF998 domain-containing protein, partial [Candidatus Ranarchaeia archaeon]
ISLNWFLGLILCSTIGGIFGGVMLSPWFTWTGNALSDIGVYERGLYAATVFNSGLIIGGVMTILLSIRFYNMYSDHWGSWLGVRTLTFAGGALTTIGLFTETSPPYHFIASVLFFVALPISMWLFSIRFLQEQRGKLGITSFSLPFISMLAWGIPYYNGVAIPELISSISGWIWLTILIYSSKT